MDNKNSAELDCLQINQNKKITKHFDAGGNKHF